MSYIEIKIFLINCVFIFVFNFFSKNLNNNKEYLNVKNIDLMER